jgi:hypothetical protein
MQSLPPTQPEIAAMLCSRVDRFVSQGNSRRAAVQRGARKYGLPAKLVSSLIAQGNPFAGGDR